MCRRAVQTRPRLRTLHQLVEVRRSACRRELADQLRLAIERKLRLPQRLQRRLALPPEPLVEQGHEHSRRLVIDLPQAGDDILRPGQVERPLEAEDPLAAAHESQARLAGRKYHQLQSHQVEPGDRLGSQDAPVVVGQDIIPAPREIGAGQHQA